MPATTKTQVIHETVLILHQRFPAQKDPLLQMAVWEAQLHSWCRDINETSAKETLSRIAQILRLLFKDKVPPRQIESALFASPISRNCGKRSSTNSNRSSGSLVRARA